LCLTTFKGGKGRRAENAWRKGRRMKWFGVEKRESLLSPAKNEKKFQEKLRRTRKKRKSSIQGCWKETNSRVRVYQTHSTKKEKKKGSNWCCSGDPDKKGGALIGVPNSTIFIGEKKKGGDGGD